MHGLCRWALGSLGSRDDKKKKKKEKKNQDQDNNSRHTGDSQKTREMSPPSLSTTAIYHSYLPTIEEQSKDGVDIEEGENHLLEFQVGILRGWGA